MKNKFLNLALAIALVCQSFLGTGVAYAESTNNEVVESVESVENMNEPTIEDIEDKEPIVKEEVLIENEKVEEIENPPKVDESQLQLISEDESYDSDDYVVVTGDGLMTLATAYVGEKYRIPNTTYDFSSIISTWKTQRGMPKLYANTGGVEYTAFCIEPGVMHETGGNMTSGYNSLTYAQREKINHILMYGYGNNGNYSDDSYVVTQVAIWEVVANQPSWGMLWGQLVQPHDNRNRLYADLLDNVDKHGVIPSFMSDNRFNPKETTLTWNGSSYTVTLTDTNNVLSKYKVVSNNGDVKVSQSGNKLTLTTTNPNADVTLRLTKQATTGGSTLYWISSTKQDLVTGGQDDPVHAYLKINVNSVGNVKIIKKSTSGVVIPNTQFRITGNGVDQTVTTGNDGSIVVPNLTTGTYTVREVSVPSPYILDTTPKTVTVNPNTTAIVEFTNDVAKAQIEVTKKSEFGALVQGAVFEIKNAHGVVVDTITTGINGVATSSKLELGTYTVTEISVPSPYILDTTPKTVTLNYANMTTPVVFGQVEVINKVAKAQIEVTKKSEIGDLIQGAVFEIRDNQNNVVEEITTGANGVATSSELALGTYTVTEKFVPSPLILDTTPKTVTLNYANMTTPVVFGSVEFVNEIAKGYFKLQKVDNETGLAKPQGSASLENAVYEVRDNQGVVVDTLKTDKNGYAESKVLPLGNYTIQEIQASEGYLIDPQIYSVSLSYSDMNTPVVTTSVTSNEQVMKQPIEIMKVQGEVAEQTLWNKLANFFSGGSGVMKPLEGAEFTITSKTTGQVVDVMVTNKDGYAKSIELPYDTYIVSETKVPHNHYKADDFEVVINQNSSVPLHYTVANKPLTAYLKVVKVDEETGKVIPLSGVQFKIKNLDTGEYVKQKVTYPYPQTVEVFETNDEGMFITPKVLIYGNYQLEEIKAPNGYVILKEPVKFTIDQNDTFIDDVDLGLIKEVVVGNQAVKGQLNVDKIGEFLTDFKENETGIDFIIEELPLADVTFNIYAREDIVGQDGTVWFTKDELVETITTTKDGKATSSELPLGKYYITEIKAPNGYILDGIEYDFEFTYQDQNTSLVLSNLDVFNKLQTVKVNLLKVGEQQNGEYAPLPNVKFGLYAKEDIKLSDTVTLKADTLIQTQTTNQDGELSFESKLPLGTYYVQEISADDNYVISDTKYEFTFKGLLQDQDVISIDINNGDVITNELVRGGFELTKKSETGEILADVEFELYSKFKEHLGTFTTDENGKIKVENLIYGDYLLVETKTVNRHQLLDEPIKISIRKDGEIVEFDVENELTEVHIDKYDEDGNKLFGAIMQIINKATGEVVEEWETTDETKVIEGLDHGDYILREITAPNGFQKILDLEFTVTDDNGITVLEVTDELTEVHIDKYDEDGNKLFGATMQIISKETGEIMAEWETTDETKVVEGLPHGDYILREITAPNGFQKILDLEFTVTDENGITVLEVTDELTKTIVQKVDERGHLLSGAHLQIINANGEIVKDFVTTGEEFLIEGLLHGTYTLHEVSAPEGYELAEDIIFTVTDENGDLVIEMVDKKIKPTTGFEQNTLMFGGIALVIVGSLVATKKRKRNN